MAFNSISIDWNSNKILEIYGNLSLQLLIYTTASIVLFSYFVLCRRFFEQAKNSHRYLKIKLFIVFVSLSIPANNAIRYWIIIIYEFVV